MQKEFKYFCEECGYRKNSTKPPSELTKCPFCGEQSLKIDTLTTDLLVKEAKGD
jgi:rubrerythrin